MTQQQLSAMRSDYNQHSQIQRQILTQLIPMFNAAVNAHSAFDVSSEKENSSSAQPFIIADFGCSTGLNSSDFLSHVIGKVRERYGFDKCPTMLVVLNDLAKNEWSELFGFIHEDARSFLRQHPGVFSLSSGKSFYEQILPSESLQIGISSYSLHWCSRLPVKIVDHFLSAFASANEREQFKQVAAEDWCTFLKARSTELSHGGILALNIISTNSSADNVLDELYKAVKSVHEQGIINDEELRNFNCRVHFRSIEEVSDQRVYEALGLELISAEAFPATKAVYFQDYLEHKDPHRFALEWSSGMLAVFEPSFLDALSHERTEEEIRLIRSKLKMEYTARLAQDPEKFSENWNTMGVIIRKK